MRLANIFLIVILIISVVVLVLIGSYLRSRYYLSELYLLKSETFRLPTTLPTKYTFYNPSLLKFGDDMIVVSRVEWKQRWNELNSSVILQKISKCFIDNVSIPILLSLPFQFNTCHRKSPIPFVPTYGQGYEDPRIFMSRGEIYVLVTVSCDPAKNISINILQLNDDLTSVKKLIKPTDQRPIEKNWNPFLPEQGLFVSAINPHEVIHIDLETGEKKLLYSTESSGLKKYYPKKFSIRGSTKYIETNSGYLAIAHGIDSTPKYYFNVCYLVEKTPPYRILSFSNKFRITQDSLIEFVSGIELVGNKVWLSYGIADKQANIAIVDLTYLTELATQHVAF